MTEGISLKEARDILGVIETATCKQIETAFRRKSRHHHPDGKKEGASESAFQRLTEAKKILLDSMLAEPERRAREELEKQEEMEEEIRGKRTIAVFVDLDREDLIEGGDYRVPVKVRQTCDTCKGTMVNSNKTIKECFCCRGKKVIAASRGKVTKCTLCFGTGYGITESNMCKRCFATGTMVYRKNIICTIPRRCNDGQLVGIVDHENYLLHVFARAKKEEEIEEPSPKRRKTKE